MTNITDYFASASSEEKDEYKRIRGIVLSAVPDVDETISYGMPTFKYQDKSLLHFGIFKDHLSLFPASSLVVGSLSDRLAEFKTSKGAIQYTLDKVVPDEVVQELVSNRLKEINNK